jgi:signal peptidase II
VSASPLITGTVAGMPRLGIVVAAASVVADQLSKYIMVERVMRPEGVTATPYFTDSVIDVLPIFNLRLSWNAGISFSLFSSGEATTTALLLVVQVGITLLLLWWLRQFNRPWMQVACGLIIGGALGNIVDRALYGAVADFLDFHWGVWHFPTFNVADTCISVGAGLWLLDAAFSRPHDADQTDQPKDSAP